MTDIAPEVIDISRLDSNGPVITLSKDDETNSLTSPSIELHDII